LAKSILIDEFHLSISVPADLPQHACDAIIRALDSPRLHAVLRQAVREALQHFAALRRVKVRLTR
jgi:hypothetical protein